MKTHIVLLGPPGSGKDTQGKILSCKLGIPLISSGEALRTEIENGSEIGLEFEKLIARGALVPDEVMFEFFTTILSRYNLSEGFVLNGFPRTLKQAEFLSGYLKEVDCDVNCAIYINVPDTEIIKRICDRLLCGNCGAVYNAYLNPPKNDSICDRCGAPLQRREDDEEQVVLKRLEVYHNETAPLIEFYKLAGVLFEVDGVGDIGSVTQRLLEVIND